MPDLTPKSLTELQRLYEAAFAVGAPEDDWEEWTSEAADAFPALLDAAARLAEVEAERDALAAKVEMVRTVGDLTARHIGRQVRTGSGMSVPLDWAWFLTLTSGDLDTPCELLP